MISIELSKYLEKLLFSTLGLLLSFHAYAEPALIEGAVVCEEMKSMYKANAIARSNNPYVSLPYDCAKLANPIPLRSANSYGGLVKVEIEADGLLIQAWTTDDYISYQRE